MAVSAKRIWRKWADRRAPSSSGEKTVWLERPGELDDGPARARCGSGRLTLTRLERADVDAGHGLAQGVASNRWKAVNAVVIELFVALPPRPEAPVNPTRRGDTFTPRRPAGGPNRRVNK